MKKALYVATVDLHIRSFHLPYLKLLHDNGYEVHVATNGDEKFPNCDVKHQICIERSPFKVKNLKAIKELRKIIEKEKFDIIHCHTPMGSVVARLAARRARKKYGTRVIYTAHGFHFYKGAPLLNWLLFYPVEKWLAKYTDTLITINKEDYELAKKKFSERCHDIQYIPGVGIDTKKFDIKMTDKEKNELRQSLGLKKDDFILTCVARLDKNKNQGFLIDAMQEIVKGHDNIHLLLVGRDELNGYYQKKVKEQKLDKNVHFLGNRDDIPELLHIADVVVSASKREGLPVNVIEAFACGVPVVALECRGMKDLIKDGENGFILDIHTKKLDSEIVNRIVELYKLNNSSINEIKYNNLNKAKEYIVENLQEKYRNIYFHNRTLMFIHGGAMIKESHQGNFYCGGSYSKEVWMRYYSIAPSVTVLFRKDKRKYNEKELQAKFQPFYLKNDLILFPNIVESKNPIKIIKNIINCKKIIKKSVINNDVIVARVPSLVSYVAIKYARKYNKKTLTEVVGCGFDSLWNHSFIGKILAIPEFIMQRHCVRKSTNVMYVTEMFLQKRYPTNGKSIGCSDVVLNDISHNNLDMRIDKIKNKTDSKIILATVGAVNVACKGQKYVIEALAKLKKMGLNKYEYHIIGSGNQNKLKALAKKYDVESQVVFTGPLPHEKVMIVYDKIHIYVQPSTVEGLCRSVLEAMSKACPCIVSDAGGNAELIDSQFVFNKKNINELANLIRKMDSVEMINQAKKNYNRIQNYRYEVINERRNKFYR